MKYKKLTLDINNVGLIKDRLNKLTSNGIVKIERVRGDINPTKKNMHFTSSPSYKRNSAVGFEKRGCLGKFLFIHCDGFHWFGRTVFNFGDIFYLGNDVIFVKSGKPDYFSKKIEITKITLLSRSDAPDAMNSYREKIRYMINMSCYYYNGWDRFSVPDHEVDEHIAFLDENKGKEVKNPAYPYKSDISWAEDMYY